jgi:hypothetical protein
MQIYFVDITRRHRGVRCVQSGGPVPQQNQSHSGLAGPHVPRPASHAWRARGHGRARSAQRARPHATPPPHAPPQDGRPRYTPVHPIPSIPSHPIPSHPIPSITNNQTPNGRRSSAAARADAGSAPGAVRGRPDADAGRGSALPGAERSRHGHAGREGQREGRVPAEDAVRGRRHVRAGDREHHHRHRHPGQQLQLQQLALRRPRYSSPQEE